MLKILKEPVLLIGLAISIVFRSPLVWSLLAVLAIIFLFFKHSFNKLEETANMEFDEEQKKSNYKIKIELLSGEVVMTESYKPNLSILPWPFFEYTINTSHENALNSIHRSYKLGYFKINEKQYPVSQIKCTNLVLE